MAEYWRWLLGLLVICLVAAAAMAAVAAVALNGRHAEQERERRLRRIANLDRVDAMTGAEFKELTAELLRRDGFCSVLVVGGARGRGADILATCPDGRDIAVQYKRQKKKATPGQVRGFIGALHVTYSDCVGVFITSSTFTEQAMDEAAGRLLLIDRDRLARWMDGDPLSL
ncbi:restriction endonuclease [Thermomonospora amylolytica]|uniref:restriction endonuclease n=1 Tax=Thermomonospora amylolytica TaxID=1411117 RepID=UPI0013008F60|nr:restriction endonuclease [Thermomonospora amylolytica]